jgi:hypothetical protein
MNIEEFKVLLANCDDESEVDTLCWRWLKNAARDNGKEGEVAVQLMRIVESELMP